MTVPPWAYEKAELRPYDPAWSVRARAEAERLAELLAPWLADGGVAHVGSTAVPGLAAKPIVDLMASVPDLDTVVAEAPLSAAGWHYVPRTSTAAPGAAST